MLIDVWKEMYSIRSRISRIELDWALSSETKVRTLKYIVLLFKSRLFFIIILHTCAVIIELFNRFLTIAVNVGRQYWMKE